MFNRDYDKLSKRIDELECRLENHISAEKDILYEIECEFKRRIIYSKYITVNECCKLIPFDIFDVAINGKILYRGCTKEYFPKLANNVIGIKDVRISLRESLVDLIVEV
ncbi:MAG: hypothetical protein [Bacteriophage sp.]|nr:MAG: hypothetical protein [Bacteriophage sp.]